MSPAEDPFGNAGDDEEVDRTGRPERPPGAAERLRDRDVTDPEPVERRPPAPRPPSRYAWVVGILMLMGVGALLLTTAVPNRGHGVQGPSLGERLPAFAAPSAAGSLEGDANVCQRRPCQRETGGVPACEVRAAGVVNLCELRRRAVVLTFVVTEGADCEPQVDRVERMMSEFPQVGFATVLSGTDHDEAAQIARRRRWTEPVAVDEDGAVVNLYRVGVCPTTIFALPGGRVVETALGNLTEAELRTKVRRLLRRQAKASGRR